MQRNKAVLILGILLVAAGVIVTGNMLGLWSFSLYFHGWWTLFIIVPCLVALINGGFDVFPLVGLGVGVLLLLDAQDIMDFSRTVKLLIPVAIIALGLRLIFRPKSGWNVSTKMSGSYTSILTSRNVLLENELFTSCETLCVWGGIKLDLRNCRFEGESRIDTTTVFAGTEILVPANVKVNTSDCFAIVGGITQKKPELPLPADAPVLHITGVCAFAGVEIKQF